MTQSAMLTTTDNPFDPYAQFDEWYAYDVDMGHHCCSFLARITKSSNELSEADQLLAVSDAIDEIVRENVNGLFKKVTPKSSVKTD